MAFRLINIPEQSRPWPGHLLRSFSQTRGLTQGLTLVFRAPQIFLDQRGIG